MALSSLNLFEPLANAMVALLSSPTVGLQVNINLLNASLAPGDLYPVPAVGQIVPYVPVPSTLEVGGPVVGVQELPAEFADDIQVSMDAEHHYAVVGVVQNADHITLVWQLRRIAQAIGYTIQQDRLAQVSILRSQGGAYSVNFKGTVPGPVLGDLDPVTPDAPPRSYLSWTALLFSSRRREV